MITIQYRVILVAYEDDDSNEFDNEVFPETEDPPPNEDGKRRHPLSGVVA